VSSAGGICERFFFASPPCSVAASAEGPSAGDPDPRPLIAHAADLRSGAVGTAAAGSAAHGVCAAVDRVKRLRRQLGLCCKQRRRFQDEHRFLSRAASCRESAGAAFRCSISVPPRTWLSDIIYILTEEGWIYQVGHKDMCTRKIVGYAMGERMPCNSVIESLRRAAEATCVLIKT